MTAYQPPPAGYGYAPPPTHGKAVTALVLGILGLTFCGLFTGIPAIVVGRNAEREIDASGGRLGGRGMATAGKVCGIISTVLGVIGVVLFIGLFAIGGMTTSSFHTTCVQTATPNGDGSTTCS